MSAMENKRHRPLRADQHGTITGYTYGCHCEDCLEAHRALHQRYKNELLSDPDDPRHGTVGGYSYGCRCGLCQIANSVAVKDRAADFRHNLADPRHGTTSAALWSKCRCASCLQAMDGYREQQAQSISENPDDPRHGTTTGYTMGCRCEDCRNAKIEGNADSARPEYNPTRASHAELQLFAQGLGLSLPRNGPRREALIKRYNRLHPERPYTAESETDHHDRHWKKKGQPVS